MVSHDQHLISMVCDELWVVGDRTVKRWSGDVLSYKRKLEESF